MLSAATVFDGPEVTLPQMLDARERRASEQRRLLESARPGETLLCVTLGVPGPVKTSEALEWAFDQIVVAARLALGEAPVSSSERLGGPTGPELLMLVSMDALGLKRSMVHIEEEHPLGRLADIDVVGRAGAMPRPLSRLDLGLAPRNCLVCGREAKLCARSRAHGVPEMQRKIASIIEEGGYEDRGKED